MNTRRRKNTALHPIYGKIRIEIWSGVILASIGLAYFPLSPEEITLLSGAYAWILAAEIISVAIGRALRNSGPRFHSSVPLLHDISSLAVFIAVLFAFATVLTIVLHRAGFV